MSTSKILQIPLSWFIFACFCGLVAVTLVARFGDGWLHDLYARRYPLFWYGAWLLLAIATAGPIFNITRERHEVPLGVLIGVSVAHVVTFLVISVITLNKLGNVAAITALLAATVAASMVGIGWVVQHQSGARSSRRAHTFNILMQSRLSSEFQNKVKLKADMYSAGSKVATEDVELFNKIGFDQRKITVEEQRHVELRRAQEASKSEINTEYDEKISLLERKYESLQGVKYLAQFL